MSITLTPDQQAKLDAFESAAEAAGITKLAFAGAKLALGTSQMNLDHLTMQLATDQAAAIDAAEAFIESFATDKTPTTPAGLKK